MDCFGEASAIRMVSLDEEFICPEYDTDLDMLCLDCSSGSELEEPSQISSLDLPIWTDTGSDFQFDELIPDSDNSIEEISTSSSSESKPAEYSDQKCQEFYGEASDFEPDPTTLQSQAAATLWFMDTFAPPMSYKKARMMRRITIEQAFVSYFAEKGQIYENAPIIFDKSDAEQIASEILARRVKIGRAGRKLKNDKPVRNRSQYMKLHGALMKAKWKRVISKDGTLTQYFYFRSVDQAPSDLQ